MRGGGGGLKGEGLIESHHDNIHLLLYDLVGPLDFWSTVGGGFLLGSRGFGFYHEATR